MRLCDARLCFHVQLSDNVSKPLVWSVHRVNIQISLKKHNPSLTKLSTVHLKKGKKSLAPH